MLGHAFADLTPIDTKDILNAKGLFQAPSESEYLGAHLSMGFDRSTTGRIVEETRIQNAEEEAGQADFEYRQAAMDLAAQGVSPEDVGLKHSKAMSEEEWKASPYFREKIKYRPDMTQKRAQIMAENYDERQHDKLIVAAGDQAYGIGMRALGFGAMMLGTLPDPINFVPFASGFNAARIGAQAGIGAAIKAGAKAGVINGAVGNALVDAIAIPDLRARGEDLGFTDFLLDTAFGAVLGGTLGALGGGLGGYVGAKRQAYINDIISRLQEDQRAFDSLDNNYLDIYGLATAQKSDAPLLSDSRILQGEDVGVAPESGVLPRNEDADVARAGIVGEDRRDLMRAQEKSVTDFSEGRSVDVRQILGESEAVGKAYDLVYRDASGGAPDEILAVISSPEFERILIERGPATPNEKGGFDVKEKEFKKKYGTGGWGLVKVIWRHGVESKQKYKVTRDDLTKLPSVLREYEQVESAVQRVSKREHRWVVQDKEGVYTIYSIKQRRKGYKDPTLITVFRTKDSRYGLSEKRSLPTSSAGENSHYSDKSPNYRDTTVGSTAQTPQRLEGAATNDGSPNLFGELNVAEERPKVNYAIEQELDYTPAPETKKDAAAIADATEKAEQSLFEEISDAIERARQEGLITEEQQREMLLNKQQTERAAKYDELGQTAVECVWNAVE